MQEEKKGGFLYFFDVLFNNVLKEKSWQYIDDGYEKQTFYKTSKHLFWSDYMYALCRI